MVQHLLADDGCSSAAAPGRAAAAVALRPASAPGQPGAGAISSLAVAEEFSSPADASRPFVGCFSFSATSFGTSQIFTNWPSFARLAQGRALLLSRHSSLFWWHVVQPWPSHPYWPRWAMIPYLLLADLQNTAWRRFLSFYDRVAYPTYANAPRFGIEPLSDQATAGAIMWVPGSIAFIVPAALIADAVSVSEPTGAASQTRSKPKAPMAASKRREGRCRSTSCACRFSAR